MKLLPEKKNLTVVVNDIRNAVWLEDHTDFNVYILGGLVRRGYHYTTLPTRNEFLGMINIDKGFFSCNGLSGALPLLTLRQPKACVRSWMCAARPIL